MSGQKIIDGLRDAVAGNFSRVTIDGQTWQKIDPAVSPDVRQRTATSALVVTVEQLCASGILPESKEQILRWLVAQVRIAYGPHIPERDSSNVIQIGDRDPAYTKTIEDVAREVGT